MVREGHLEEMTGWLDESGKCAMQICEGSVSQAKGTACAKVLKQENPDV